MFAMLGDAGDDQEEDDDDDEGEPALEPVVESTPASLPSKKSKKKKKKAKAKNKTTAPPQGTADAELDEIDQALRALNLVSAGNRTTEPLTPAISEETQQLCAALSIDTTHLHAANEMKRLFGRAALQHVDDDAPRQRAPQGIAARANGRHQPLTGLSLRRNIFVQGKEEWPRAASGGLSMEIVSANDDGTTEYRFVHNAAYQEAQRQFQAVVASHNPELMVRLLHPHPYHISTLLQVSEIARQQRDNAAASDFLERALFAFGRTVHTTFAATLAAGKARLSFSRPENREFFLAIWRYIATLCVRATFRTALEWARLLLSVSPEEDPYCIRLLIDQLALRGRSPESLLSLVESDALERAWKIPPNIAFSTALAHLRTKSPVKARSCLKHAIRQYPWLAAALCKELDISPIPKPVWGLTPSNDYQELLMRMYVQRAKDLWNTTEGTTLLVEICYTFDAPLATHTDSSTHTSTSTTPTWLAQINGLDLARHVLLTDDPSLVSLLDPSLKAQYTSVSDPLPPPINTRSYTTAAPRAPQLQAPERTELMADLEQLRHYFHNINLPGILDGGLAGTNLAQALTDGGSSIDELQRNSERLEIVRQRLQEGGVQFVVEDQGGEDGLDGVEND